MPRKEGEGAPLHDAGKMSEETREQVYERDREHRGPPQDEAERQRHSRTAADSGPTVPRGEPTKRNG